MKKAIKKKNRVPRSLRKIFPQVTECKDSRTPVDIHVTTGDSQTARKMEGDACAMARAVCRQTKADGALIGMAYSYIITGSKAVRFQTSNAIAREITSFDRHEDFQPGEYRLSAVSPCQLLGKTSKRATPSSTSGPKDQRRIVHKRTLNVRSVRGAQ